MKGVPHKGKIAVLVGGAGYLGTALSQAMRRAGITVVTLDKKRPQAADWHLSCDVTSKASLRRCRDRIVRRFSRQPKTGPCCSPPPRGKRVTRKRVSPGYKRVSPGY